MPRMVALRPINDIIDGVVAASEQEKVRVIIDIERRTKETIHRIETNRQAAALLDAEGFEVWLMEPDS